MNTRMTVTTFKAIAERKIEMYNANIEFIDRIIKFAKDYDGKKMDKRFLDKVEAIAPNHCRIGFDGDIYGNRENRFRLVYGDRYISSVGAYLENHDYTQIIYKDYTLGDYINKDDFRLNYEIFKETLKKQKEYFVNYRDELIYAKDHTDDIIATYNEIDKLVKEKMQTIPSMLRQSIFVNCPIYK